MLCFTRFFFFERQSNLQNFALQEKFKTYFNDFLMEGLKPGFSALNTELTQQILQTECTFYHHLKSLKKSTIIQKPQHKYLNSFITM